MMIFDVRYIKLQAMCTIPNCLRIELEQTYSEDSLREKVIQYTCLHDTDGGKTTICVMGMGPQNSESMSVAEAFHA